MLVGCYDEGDPPLPEKPLDLGISGGFRATLAGGSRLTVASADGRVLLDGLESGEVAEGEPPLVGFAVRDLTITYDMQFGAFKPDDVTNGPWKPAAKIGTETDADASVLTLRDEGGKALAQVRLTTPEEGHLVFDITPGEGPERRFSMGFACDEADAFAGFGSQTHDVNHRGQTVPTFVQEQGIGKVDHDEYTLAWYLVGRRHSSHIPIPQYLARRGYVLTAETNLEARFALCSESETAARVELTMPAKLHVFDGPTADAALTRSSATFGRPRLPPRVAFAPWNDGIFGSDAVRAMAQRLRDEDVPSSVIWSEDWKGAEWSGDGYSLSEEWKVDENLYPNFAQLANDLHALGFDFHVYFNPFIYKSSSVWTELESKGYLIKKADGSTYTFTGAKFTDSSLVDLTNPDARAWVIGKMHDAMALGADGWMNDFAEWLPTDSVTFGGSGNDIHNIYPVLWQQTAREAIDTAPDGKERLFFGRSGWLGTPQLADVIWAGDQRTDMQPDDGLPTVLPIGIGLGVTGVSTYGHDIGGYQSATNEVTSKETFFRWASLGAWSPVMRTHHGTKPSSYPGMDPVKNQGQWRWDTDAETIAHYRNYTKLHIALLPMWEALAKHASETGVPIWRGLFMAYPNDPQAWSLLDEVMIGDNLLVAPVVTKGKTSRSVYLPEGTWYPWQGGGAVSGGSTLDVTADLTEIPVFARAGSVIVALPDGVMTLVNSSPEVPGPESVGDSRVVYAFLGGEGSFTETGGLTYSLSQSGDLTGDLTFAWEGGAVGACADPVVAPCVESVADGYTIHAEGSGNLEITSANGTGTLTIAGGAQDRLLTLVVRR
ncbi:MAG: hypothetical protein IPK82_41600 [Polyangiaceae bacterium]|nr:hypothetical protein [Polyangiaceae bacterium]